MKKRGLWPNSPRPAPHHAARLPYCLLRKAARFSMDTANPRESSSYQRKDPRGMRVAFLNYLIGCPSM
jgi:hypothetical protein